MLSKRTGLGSDCLTAMTLQPWEDLAVIIDRPTRRLIRPPHWRHTGNYTRCLEETAGRWQIAWRLPWSFACTRHLFGRANFDLLRKRVVLLDT